MPVRLLAAIAFACFACARIAAAAHGSEHLKDLLIGQILWVSPSSLILVAVFHALALAVWFAFRRRMGHIGSMCCSRWS